MPLKWSDLTLDEQIAVEEQELTGMLRALIEVGPAFLPPELRPNFYDAADEMEQMRTPWFLGERLMEDEQIVAHLRDRTNNWVREAIYLVGNEVAIEVPAVQKK